MSEAFVHAAQRRVHEPAPNNKPIYHMKNKVRVSVEWMVIHFLKTAYNWTVQNGWT